MECVAQRPTISDKQNLGLNSGLSDYMFSFLMIILSNSPDEGTGSGLQRGRSGEEADKEAITFLIPHCPFISHQALCFHIEAVFSKIGTRAKINYMVLHPAFIPKPYNW